MKLLAFILALLMPAIAFAGSISNSSAQTFQVAPATTGKQTHIRALLLVSAGTATVQFVYGTKTSTDCDTNPTALTGVMSMAANSQIAAGDGVSDLMVAPAGKQVCITQTGAVQVSGFIKYIQTVY